MSSVHVLACDPGHPHTGLASSVGELCKWQRVSAGPRRILSGRQYDRYMPAAVNPGRVRVVVANPSASLDDTIRLMQQLAVQGIDQVRDLVAALVNEYRPSTPQAKAELVWSFIYSHIQYRPDAPNREQVRTPARTWRDRQLGVDCDCMSVMAASMLAALGLRPYYRLASYSRKGGFSHVYVVTPIDNQWVVIDPVLGRFNSEKPFTQHKDIIAMPQLELLDGYRHHDDQLGVVFLAPLAAGATKALTAANAAAATTSSVVATGAQSAGILSSIGNVAKGIVSSIFPNAFVTPARQDPRIEQARNYAYMDTTWRWPGIRARVIRQGWNSENDRAWGIQVNRNPEQTMYEWSGEMARRWTLHTIDTMPEIKADFELLKNNMNAWIAKAVKDRANRFAANDPGGHVQAIIEYYTAAPDPWSQQYKAKAEELVRRTGANLNDVLVAHITTDEVDFGTVVNPALAYVEAKRNAAGRAVVPVISPDTKTGAPEAFVSQDSPMVQQALQQAGIDPAQMMTTQEPAAPQFDPSAGKPAQANTGLMIAGGLAAGLLIAWVAGGSSKPAAAAKPEPTLEGLQHKGSGQNHAQRRSAKKSTPKKSASKKSAAKKSATKQATAKKSKPAAKKVATTRTSVANTDVSLSCKLTRKPAKKKSASKPVRKAA